MLSTKKANLYTLYTNTLSLCALSPNTQKSPDCKIGGYVNTMICLSLHLLDRKHYLFHLFLCLCKLHALVFDLLCGRF